MRTLARKSAAGPVLVSLLLLWPVMAARAGDPVSTSPETRLVGVVNLNTATAEQLELLPGIGPARARGILGYRKDRGPFKRVDELVAVSGIGPSAVDRIRPHCSVEGKTTARLER
jgi:competence protein ComEA